MEFYGVKTWLLFTLWEPNKHGYIYKDFLFEKAILFMVFFRASRQKI